MSLPTKPIVLCISGHDPTGGAGIQADIEACIANDGKPIGIISALTAQNTAKVATVEPVSTTLIKQQVDLLLSEFTPDAIKIGLLPTGEICDLAMEIINQLYEKNSSLTIVIDPIIRSGMGNNLTDAHHLKAIKKLISTAKLITPNHAELKALGGIDTVLKSGCKHVLLTTTDSTNDHTITHHLYQSGYQTKTINFSYPRLNGIFHGSGCTLASAITTRLANGCSIVNAVSMSLDFTWQSLKHAQHTGKTQAIPERFTMLDSLKKT